MVPGLGDEHRHRALDAAAVHGEELEHVVEDRGVGALAVDDGDDLLEVVAELRRVEVGLARADPVDVAAQGVDLAVVDDHAVGVRALPARRRVGGVARVHEGDRRLDRGVVEVEEEAPHLRGDEHALVDDGPAGHRADVEDLLGKGVLGVGAPLDRAAAHVEAALEVVAGLDGVGARDEGLHDGGHAGAGGLAEVVGVDGDVAPEEELQALGEAAVLEDALGGLDAALVAREEEHGDGVVALGRQDLPVALRHLAEEAVRHLEEDAGAVAGVALEALAAAVLEVDQDRECVVHGLVRAHAVQLRDGPDAAGVVVERGVVEALPPRAQTVCLVMSHVASSPLAPATPRSASRVRRSSSRPNV